MRAFCSLISESHNMRNDILVCEGILSTAVASLNCIPAPAPFMSPSRIGFIADIQRSCSQFCQFAISHLHRIVLSVPAQVSHENVHKLLRSCGCLGLDASLVHDVVTFLTLPDLWQSQVIQILPFPNEGMIHFLIRDSQINIARVIGLTLRTGAGCASLFFPVPAFEV